MTHSRKKVKKKQILFCVSISSEQSIEHRVFALFSLYRFFLLFMDWGLDSTLEFYFNTMKANKRTTAFTIFIYQLYYIFSIFGSYFVVFSNVSHWCFIERPIRIRLYQTHKLRKHFMFTLLLIVPQPISVNNIFYFSRSTFICSVWRRSQNSYSSSFFDLKSTYFFCVGKISILFT